MEKSGNDVTLKIIEGAIHGFDNFPNSDLVSSVMADRFEWLRNSFA
jgi:hypothetical protein